MFTLGSLVIVEGDLCFRCWIACVEVPSEDVSTPAVFSGNAAQNNVASTRHSFSVSIVYGTTYTT